MRLVIVCVKSVTGTTVEVLVVDDDAVADAGVVQAVSEAVGVSLGVHLHGLPSCSLGIFGTAQSKSSVAAFNQNPFIYVEYFIIICSNINISTSVNITNDLYDRLGIDIGI